MGVWPPTFDAAPEKTSQSFHHTPKTTVAQTHPRNLFLATSEASLISHDLPYDRPCATLPHEYDATTPLNSSLDPVYITPNADPKIWNSAECYITFIPGIKSVRRRSNTSRQPSLPPHLLIDLPSRQPNSFH